MTVCFIILLASLTASLLVGVTLALITIRGYADVEDDYTTRVTLSRKSPTEATNPLYEESFADSIRQEAIEESMLAPFIESKYVSESAESFFVPVSSISLRSLDNVGNNFYNIGAVIKITSIETVDIANPSGVEGFPIRMTIVFYESLYTFFGSTLGDTAMIFLDDYYADDPYIDMQAASTKIRSILEVGKSYLIKSDTIFFTSNSLFRSIMSNPDILPVETVQKLERLEYILDCGITDPESDRFIPLDVSTAEEAEDHPLVKGAEINQQNFYDWPYGIIHMSVQLVQGLKNTMPFYYNELVISQGRDFTKEEIENGDPVIVISEDTLIYSKLNIGDKVKIMLNQRNEFIMDYKEYEIIGTFKSTTDYAARVYSAVGEYTGNPKTHDYDGKAYVGFLQPNGNLIYLPQAAIKNDPLIDAYFKNNHFTDENGERLITLDNFYFVLKNNKDIKAFIDELNSSDYIRDNYDIDYADQGYSKAIEILNQLRVTSIVVIVAAFLVTVVTAVFLMLLFVARRSRDVVIMMSLGTKKRSIVATLAWGLMIIYAVGCLSGIIIGGSVLEKTIYSITTPLYLEDNYPQFRLNQAPIIQPNLNITVPESVYFITMAAMFGILLIAFLLSVINKLKHKPSDILHDSLK